PITEVSVLAVGKRLDYAEFTLTGEWSEGRRVQRMGPTTLKVESRFGLAAYASYSFTWPTYRDGGELKMVDEIRFTVSSATAGPGYSFYSVSLYDDLYTRTNSFSIHSGYTSTKIPVKLYFLSETTPPLITSYELKGKILEAGSGKPVKNAVVYIQTRTMYYVPKGSIIRDKYIFDTTDENGEFTIRLNLPARPGEKLPFTLGIGEYDKINLGLGYQGGEWKVVSAQPLKQGMKIITNPLTIYVGLSDELFMPPSYVVLSLMNVFSSPPIIVGDTGMPEKRVAESIAQCMGDMVDAALYSAKDKHLENLYSINPSAKLDFSGYTRLVEKCGVNLAAQVMPFSAQLYLGGGMESPPAAQTTTAAPIVTQVLTTAAAQTTSTVTAAAPAPAQLDNIIIANQGPIAAYTRASQQEVETAAKISWELNIPSIAIGSACSLAGIFLSSASPRRGR
ncbi:MAG: hypothetical protein QW692_04045, partial [Nitrososphaerota archaeon]